MQLSFLLNWYLNPYHTPIVVAKELGFFAKRDIDLAILEPTNPSDVTKIIGGGEIQLGLKAMVHCFAARSRGYSVKSIGTVLDEPPTGLISLKSKHINELSDIKGKRLGYVGEFGKIMIDLLAKEGGISINDYECIRVGMDAANAIIHNKVDAAIGLSCFQQLEVEALKGPANLLRIDDLAKLGCCCFCSIMVIANESLIESDPHLLAAFMSALQEGAKLTREQPDLAFDALKCMRPSIDTTLYRKIFNQCLPFFSADCKNVERDWQKVGLYAKRLGIIESDVRNEACYTNDYVSNVNSLEFIA